MDNLFNTGVSFYELLFTFLAYSFLGWCTEVCFAALKTGKFVNRGFLNGPVCPIYGTGLSILLLVITPFLKYGYFVTFLLAMLVCSLLEFVTGYFMEKIFNRKWWDYSKEPFNVKGYVCLRFSILWGLACVLVFDIVHPFLKKVFHLIPQNIGWIILICFSVLFIADLIVTILQLRKIRRFANELLKVSFEMRRGSNFIGKGLYKATESAINVGSKIQKEVTSATEEWKKNHAELLDKEQKIREKILSSRFFKAFPNLSVKKDTKEEDNTETTNIIQNETSQEKK